jgi:hypothetical protein
VISIRAPDKEKNERHFAECPFDIGNQIKNKSINYISKLEER